MLVVHSCREDLTPLLGGSGCKPRALHGWEKPKEGVKTQNNHQIYLIWRGRVVLCCSSRILSFGKPIVNKCLPEGEVLGSCIPKTNKTKYLSR